MNHQEKFVMFVYMEAMSRDLERGDNRARRIAELASKVPLELIPSNALNAARTLVAHACGECAAEDWINFRPVKRTRCVTIDVTAGKRLIDDRVCFDEVPDGIRSKRGRFGSRGRSFS